MTYSNQKPLISQPQLMDEAKNALSGNWGLAAGAFFVMMLVSVLASIIPFVSILIGGPLTLGMAIFSQKIARNQDAQISNLFDGFSNFGNALGTYLLMMLAIVVGFIFFIIPGIMLALGLSQAMYLLVDNDKLGPVDALKESWEMMKGHKMDYFILGLRFIPWMFVCIFTLGIGFFFLAPYIQVTYAKFHNVLRFGDDWAGEMEDDIIDHLVD
ncbi:MAG: putative membrane protein [Saprospiraceae bacterium]|jgi:uncharacterized membrane protein